MKKINYLKTAIVAACMFTGISCSDSFLEIQPKGKLIAERTSDYDLLLNNLDLVNIATDGHILMGDEIAFADPYFTGAGARAQRLYRWDADIYQVDEDAPETLVPMKDIYIYNMIINEVLNSTEGSEEQKKSIQAEALAGRAWTYFLLINYYGKPYNASTAATDPGFPIITRADINGNDFRRATVQQVYDFIISDLTTAIPNLLSVGVPHRLRMSKAAAEGLLAKVYMFMGNFSEALPLLNSSLDHLAASAVVTGLYNFNTAFPGFPTAPNDQENVYAKTIFNSYTASNNTGVMLTPEASALYGTDDVRRSKWYINMAFSSGTNMLRRIGTYSAYFGVRVSDLYLLRAEVKARLDDLSGAVTDLETLRKNRMPEASAAVPADIASDKLSLLQFIFDERIREFAVQGYRWFDMRRLSVDPLFITPSAYEHKVYSAAGDVTSTFIPSLPDRFTLRIPKKIRAENPNMQDNP